MNREELLKISKDLINIIIYGKNGTLRKEHFFMLSISKFIASKEKIIKTDSDGKKIYFKDDENNKRIINSFYRLIEDKIKFTIDNNEVSNDIYNNVILESNSEDLDLKKKVFIINKLRDSLAHGRYTFDIENNLIKIHNDYKVNNNNLLFKCDITPELLDRFNIKDIEVLDSTLNMIELNNHSNDYFIRLATKVMNSKQLFEKYKSYFDKIDQEKFNILYDSTLCKIDELLSMKKSNTLSYNKEELNKKDINISFRMEINKLVDRISESLVSMASIIESKVNKNSIETAIIYNHLCLLLSERQNLDFKYLRNPFTRITFKKKIEKGKETDITGSLGALKREIKLFNKKYQKVSDYPLEKQDEVMKKLFIDLYNGVMNALEVRNRNIYNRLRNGIMHFTIDKNNQRVTITDSPDHNSEDPTFKCETTNSELLEYITCIEENNSKDYSIETYIKELTLALDNYDVDENVTKNFINNLIDCLNKIDKNIKLSDTPLSLKDKFSKQNNKEYKEDIIKLRDLLLIRKEELESKQQSM